MGVCGATRVAREGIIPQLSKLLPPVSTIYSSHDTYVTRYELAYKNFQSPNETSEQKRVWRRGFSFPLPSRVTHPYNSHETPIPSNPNNASWTGQEPTNSSNNMASASGFQHIYSLFHNVTACKCAVPVRHLLSVVFFCGLWRWRQMMRHCFSSWENKEGKFSLLAEESETYAIANVDLQSNLSSFWVHIKHLPSQLFPFRKQTCLIQPHNKIQDSLRSLHNMAGISLCRIIRQCE